MILSMNHDLSRLTNCWLQAIARDFARHTAMASRRFAEKTRLFDELARLANLARHGHLLMFRADDSSR